MKALKWYINPPTLNMWVLILFFNYLKLIYFKLIFLIYKIFLLRQTGTWYIFF